MTQIFIDKAPALDQYVQHYSVRYYCSNCNHHGFVYFKKGERKHAIPCSNCQCTVKP